MKFTFLEENKISDPFFNTEIVHTFSVNACKDSKDSLRFKVKPVFRFCVLFHLNLVPEFWIVNPEAKVLLKFNSLEKDASVVTSC
jgi:hypothetical protein